MISKRLLQEADKKADDAARIRQLDMHFIACYELAHQSKRMKSAVSLLDGYRVEGLEVAGRMAQYLKPENFTKIKDQKSLKLILMHSRYDTVMYEIRGIDKYLNEESLGTLLGSLELSKDPLYAGCMSDKDWNYHILRALEYIGRETEGGNIRGFAEAARCHHVWFDQSRGYPDLQGKIDACIKIYIDIISIADAGSRYSSTIGEVIALTDVKDRLSKFLNSGRRENYKNAYNLLKHW